MFEYQISSSNNLHETLVFVHDRVFLYTLGFITRGNRPSDNLLIACDKNDTLLHIISTLVENISHTFLIAGSFPLFNSIK